MSTPYKFGIDDQAKMVDQGRADIFVAFTTILCLLDFNSYMKLLGFNSGILSIRSYLKLSCEFELCILRNVKANSAKVTGQTT